MHAKIGINASPGRLFEWLADPANARHWFAHLRHEADFLPEAGVTADPDGVTVRWTAAPAGEMRVSGLGHASELSLTFTEENRAPEPPAEEMSPDDPATNAGNALRSIKSHVENAEGGDPDMHTPGVVSREQVEEAARETEQGA